MSVSQSLEDKAVISRKLAILLEELDEECAHVQDLIAQLKINNLTAAQVEDILAELNAAIVHLNTHTKDLDKIITDEMESF